MRITDFVRPKTIEEAAAALHQLSTKAIVTAGGTAFQFLAEDTEKTAIDINSVLPKEITAKKKSFSIGAGAKIADLQEYNSHGWVLNKAASKLSTQQIRNMSTLGGNIARVFPWSDFPVVLLALGAKITVYDGKNKKSFKAKNFFKQQSAKLLNNKLLIVDISVPSVTGASGFGYHKEVRTSGGFSTLTAAALITCENNIIKDIKLAAGAGLGLPIRLKDIEHELKGKPAEKNVINEAVKSQIKSYSWKGKEGTTDSYAEHLAEVIINDVLTEALQYAKNEVK